MQNIITKREEPSFRFTNNDRVIRLNEVMKISGLKKSSIYNLIQKNQFPKQINLGANAVGWVQSEVIEWVNELIIERDLLQ